MAQMRPKAKDMVSMAAGQVSMRSDDSSTKKGKVDTRQYTVEVPRSVLVNGLLLPGEM